MKGFYRRNVLRSTEDGSFPVLLDEEEKERRKRRSQPSSRRLVKNIQKLNCVVPACNFGVPDEEEDALNNRSFDDKPVFFPVVIHEEEPVITKRCFSGLKNIGEHPSDFTSVHSEDSSEEKEDLGKRQGQELPASYSSPYMTDSSSSENSAEILPVDSTGTTDSLRSEEFGPHGLDDAERRIGIRPFEVPFFLEGSSKVPVPDKPFYFEHEEVEFLSPLPTAKTKEATTEVVVPSVAASIEVHDNSDWGIAETSGFTDRTESDREVDDDDNSSGSEWGIAETSGFIDDSVRYALNSATESGQALESGFNKERNFNYFSSTSSEKVVSSDDEKTKQRQELLAEVSEYLRSFSKAEGEEPAQADNSGYTEDTIVDNYENPEVERVAPCSIKALPDREELESESPEEGEQSDCGEAVPSPIPDENNQDIEPVEHRQVNETDEHYGQRDSFSCRRTPRQYQLGGEKQKGPTYDMRGPTFPSRTLVRRRSHRKLTDEGLDRVDEVFKPTVASGKVVRSAKIGGASPQSNSESKSYSEIQEPPPIRSLSTSVPATATGSRSGPTSVQSSASSASTTSSKIQQLIHKFEHPDTNSSTKSVAKKRGVDVNSSSSTKAHVPSNSDYNPMASSATTPKGFFWRSRPQSYTSEPEFTDTSASTEADDSFLDVIKWTSAEGAVRRSVASWQRR